MGNYQSPGVYLEEISGGAKTIAGVGTSTGAFVGIAEKGVKNKAVLVTNWSQFVKEFGNFLPNAFLAYGVYTFFAEGGTSCYVVRASSDKAKSAAVSLKDIDGGEAIVINARSEGSWGKRIKVNIEDPSEKPKETHFKLTVQYTELYVDEFEGEVSEAFDNISSATIEEKLNDISAFLNVDAVSTKRPVNGTYQLDGGVDGIEDADFEGDDNNKKGLHAFDTVDDINIVAIPDKAGDRETILGGLNYCKLRKDCFFVADSPNGISPTEALDFKKATGKYSGNAFNNSYGALYYPWIKINDPLTGKIKLIPPSGAVAGTYAYTDSTRGVHKAPAGDADGYLDSAVGIEKIITKGEQEPLNFNNVNVIRSFPSSGICIWGAKTLSADSEWKYINIRRLFLFLEESIDKATQWVVFEPNDEKLWGTVKRNITAFLLRVWRDGAFFGSTAEEAFFVKVDRENNPPEVRDAGQLIIEIGVAPVKPAEFVIIRISQKTLAK